tara:strand:+ start:3693 stop:4127 length:435 start_codon:yes stop_codon:yes gene_type:complete
MPLSIKLREMPKSSTEKDPTTMKLGRYQKSMFPEVNGYGDTRWVVGCYIDIDQQDSLKGMSKEHFAQACLAQLNEIPPRRKYERQHTSSLYGSLELLSYKFREDKGKSFIEMLLITDDQKNENFWGEGISFANYKKTRRRNSKN